MEVVLSDVEGDVLFYDLEVSPLQVWTYDRWDSRALWVDQEQYLMSFAYRWGSQKKTHYLDLRDQSSYKLDPTRDEELTKALFKLWQSASIVCAYNGDRFDMKMSKTFFMRWGLVPHKVQSIDPFKMVKKEFKLSSNSMKQSAIELGVAPKMDVGLSQLTQKIIKHDDQKAWAIFKRYNIQDVVTLIALWEKVRPYATTHINMAMHSEDYDACPRCGNAEAIVRNGTGTTKTNAMVYQEWWCRPSKGGCGHYPRSRQSTPNTKTKFV